MLLWQMINNFQLLLAVLPMWLPCICTAWKRKGSVCGINEKFLRVVTEVSMTFTVLEELSETGETVPNPYVVLRFCDVHVL